MAGEVDPEPGGLTLERALKDCAYVAANVAWHRHQAGQTAHIARRIGQLTGANAASRRVFNGAGRAVTKCHTALGGLCRTDEPLPLTFSHGDYTYTELIFADSSCGLVDFDTSCQAEPALDLGQFLAYLRLTARKIQQHGADTTTDEAWHDMLCTSLSILICRSPVLIAQVGNSCEHVWPCMRLSV